MLNNSAILVTGAAGFIESWGRGTLNIINEYKEANLPEPNFYEEHGVVKIVFKLSNGDNLNEGLNEGLNSLFKVIITNPGIQAKDISPILDSRPLKTIERQLSQLIKINKIERRGSRKTGGYYSL